MDSPSAIFPSSNLCFLLFLFLVIFSTSTFSYSSPVSTISYSDHCAHMVPEAAPTTLLPSVHPVLDPATSHYSGGERVLGRNKSYDLGYCYSQKFVNFVATDVYNTSIDGVHKIEAYLFLAAHYFYHIPTGSRPDEPSYRRKSRLVFQMNGFWSVSSSKLCMVGSAPWYSSDQGKEVNLEAVLKLNIDRNSTILYTSLISGVMESLVTSDNDPSYFEPIFIASDAYSWLDLNVTTGNRSGVDAEACAMVTEVCMVNNEVVAEK